MSRSSVKSSPAPATRKRIAVAPRAVAADAVPVARTRGRPRQFDQEVLLDAAIPIFWRHGYEGTSIADLTVAMGVTPPTLYAAFGSKEELYRQVLARYTRSGTGQARAAAFIANPSAYQAIAIYLRDTAMDFASPKHPAGCLVSTATVHCAVESKPAAEATAACRAQAIALFEQKFAAAKKSRELPMSADPGALARFYGAVIQGMSVQACDGADAKMLSALVDTALAAWPGKTVAKITGKTGRKAP